jgi:hypothetical protein
MAYSRNIDHVVFGQYDIVTWFASPYPEDFIPAGAVLPKLFVCPRCFKYTADEIASVGHQVCCIFSTNYQALCNKQKGHAGRVVYEKDTIQIYQFDGREDKVYISILY